MANLPSFESKALLREHMKKVLASLSPDRRLQGSLELFVRLKPALERASCVLSFMSLPDEIDLSLVNEWLLQRNALCLPKVAGKELVAYRIKDLKADLVRGYAGILEPHEGMVEVPLDRLDAVIVPGLAFSEDGKRLGRGGGYYDRLLAGLLPSVATYGVGFLEQRVGDELCQEEHDVPLMRVLLS